MIFLFRVRKLECVPSLCWMSKEVRETIREPKVMEKKRYDKSSSIYGI